MSLPATANGDHGGAGVGTAAGHKVDAAWETVTAARDKVNAARLKGFAGARRIRPDGRIPVRAASSGK